MIAYYGRFGNYLGQASAVPAEAPLTRAPSAVQPAPVVVSPAPAAVVTDTPVLYEDKVTFTKAALVVGGLALALLVVSATGALSRRR